MKNGRKSAAGNQKNTAWDSSAEWYNQLLESEGTYQRELILPNLLRLMNIRHGETILDMACGQGFFAREFARVDASGVAGAHIIGIDASQKLIEIARGKSKNISYYVARADKLPFLKNKSVDKIAIVLALQNLENVAGVFRECARIVRPGGSIYAVLNHPAFRVPKASSWGWDEKQKAQYRRIDRYLSELKANIEMHPGERTGEKTTSFHRPLQFYFKALSKAGFAAVALEEWNSHKKSEPGPRAKAEDTARKEIPLFMFLEARKL